MRQPDTTSTKRTGRGATPDRFVKTRTHPLLEPQRTRPGSQQLVGASETLFDVDPSGEFVFAGQRVRWYEDGTTIHYAMEPLA